jgi:hypothetical protein
MVQKMNHVLLIFISVGLWHHDYVEVGLRPSIDASVLRQGRWGLWREEVSLKEEHNHIPNTSEHQSELRKQSSMT